MTLGEWVRPPRHLVLLFVAVTMVSSSALGWSIWQLVQQDRALGTERAREQRDAAAGLAVAALGQRLGTIEQTLSRMATAETDLARSGLEYLGDLAPGAIVLVVGDGRLEAYPTGRLRYFPAVSAGPEPPATLFAAADFLEFTEANFSRGISSLRPHARSSDSVVRAHALVRLARLLRKSGQPAEAVRVYTELTAIKDVRIEGVPADLLGHGALSDLHEASGRRDDLLAQARVIDDGLRIGRWRILRPVYDLYAARVEAILGGGARSAADRDAEALAAAVGWIWNQRSAMDPGRAAIWSGDQSVLVVTRRAPGGLAAFAATPAYVESGWMRDIAPLAASSRTSIALTDLEGRPVVGSASGPSNQQSIRLSPANGLPWTLTAVSHPGTTGGPPRATAVVLSGLAAIGLLVVGGSYLIGRAVLRELRVARLQADFVSAVSHEFRTPVTALRQMSELLADGRVDGDGLRQQYYEVLKHESNRLHRLVEGLLKFGRIEAGAVRYRFEQIDAAALLERTVDEFRREAARRGFTVELRMDPAPLAIRADADAIGSVIWNLLDNAVKYSPQPSTIAVELARSGEAIAIRVRDRGIGMAPAEQARIFEKFVRGDAAERLGVPGSGIGLAVARQITLTHGGDITVESTPGVGSTFTVVLPAAAADPAADPGCDPGVTSADDGKGRWSMARQG
jgi:signal transduction histidine kinase